MPTAGGNGSTIRIVLWVLGGVGALIVGLLTVFGQADARIEHAAEAKAAPIRSDIVRLDRDMQHLKTDVAEVKDKANRALWILEERYPTEAQRALKRAKHEQSMRAME